MGIREREQPDRQEHDRLLADRDEVDDLGSLKRVVHTIAKRKDEAEAHTKEAELNNAQQTLIHLPGGKQGGPIDERDGDAADGGDDGDDA